MTKHVAIMGARRRTDRETVDRIHRGAPGAAALAGRWAKMRRVPVEAFPADWKSTAALADRWGMPGRWPKGSLIWRWHFREVEARRT